MDSSELVSAVRQAIDRAEQVARDGERAGLNDGWPFWIDVDDEWNRDAANRYREGFGPSTALRGLAADRDIIELYEREAADRSSHADSEARWWLMCDVLRALARGYGIEVGAP